MSLWEAIAVIKICGEYSSLIIDLNPSICYLDNIPSSPISDLHNVSSSFKYLNIYVTPRPTEYATSICHPYLSVSRIGLRCGLDSNYL